MLQVASVIPFSAAALVERMEQAGLRVLLVTDPINTVYGGVRAGHLDRLEEAGAVVVETGLTRLRASNPATLDA